MMRIGRKAGAGFRRGGIGIVVSVMIAVWCVGVFAAEKKELAGAPDASRAMNRETQITYRNAVSARSFSKSADLTYNPYYAMALDVALAFWAHRKVSLILDFALLKELTDSDDTTMRREVQFADIFLYAGLNDIKPIPVLGIDVLPSVRFYVPSSKVSQARTMILGIRPELLLVKRFDVLSGLAFSYAFAVRKDFHEFTTAASEAPLIDAPMGSTRSSESFFNTGRRNTSFALFNSLGLTLYLKDYIGVKLSAGIRHGFLYDVDKSDPRISYEAQSSEDVRYQMFYQGELFGHIGPAWTLSLGFLTENYQLADDATYEAPFFNRYTAVYFDVRLDVAGLVKQLGSKRGKK